MRRIGITGGIGSGKSTVARMLEAKGASIVDADQIARDIVQPGQPALDELVQAFGAGILREDGTLNRGRLAQLAFADEQGTDRLNTIMHPRIAEEARRRLAQANASVVVYDMPLLVETGQQEVVDVVLVVDVPVETQVARAVGQRGLDESDVRRRIAAQASREQRRAVADVIIDNDGTLAHTQAQVDAFWSEINQAQAVGDEPGSA